MNLVGEIPSKDNRVQEMVGRLSISESQPTETDIAFGANIDNPNPELYKLWLDEEKAKQLRTDAEMLLVINKQNDMYYDASMQDDFVRSLIPKDSYPELSRYSELHNPIVDSLEDKTAQERLNSLIQIEKDGEIKFHTANLLMTDGIGEPYFVSNNNLWSEMFNMSIWAANSDEVSEYEGFQDESRKSFIYWGDIKDFPTCLERRYKAFEFKFPSHNDKERIATIYKKTLYALDDQFLSAYGLDSATHKKTLDSRTIDEEGDSHFNYQIYKSLTEESAEKLDEFITEMMSKGEMPINCGMYPVRSVCYVGFRDSTDLEE